MEETPINVQYRALISQKRWRGKTTEASNHSHHFIPDTSALGKRAGWLTKLICKQCSPNIWVQRSNSPRQGKDKWGGGISNRLINPPMCTHIWSMKVPGPRSHTILHTKTSYSFIDLLFRIVYHWTPMGVETEAGAEVNPRADRCLHNIDGARRRKLLNIWINS